MSNDDDLENLTGPEVARAPEPILTGEPKRRWSELFIKSPTAEEACSIFEQYAENGILLAQDYRRADRRLLNVRCRPVEDATHCFYKNEADPDWVRERDPRFYRSWHAAHVNWIPEALRAPDEIIWSERPSDSDRIKPALVYICTTDAHLRYVAVVGRDARKGDHWFVTAYPIDITTRPGKHSWQRIRAGAKILWPPKK